MRKGLGCGCSEPLLSSLQEAQSQRELEHSTTEIPSHFKTVQGRSSLSEKTASVNCSSSSFRVITANYPESVFKNKVDFDHSRRAR